MSKDLKSTVVTRKKEETVNSFLRPPVKGVY